VTLRIKLVVDNAHRAVCCTSQWPAKSIFFSSRQRGKHIDVANQDGSNGHSLKTTPSNPLFPARD